MKCYFKSLISKRICYNVDRRPRLKARATTEGIEMEEYGDNGSSGDDDESQEDVENAQVTFLLPKQHGKVSSNMYLLRIFLLFRDKFTNIKL